MKSIGHIRPRSALEIAASSWSVGGETLDRDFADYHSYKSYLGPLGAKAIRVQTGWAKCEKKRGEYEFGWLDAVVDDARSQGVQPWLELSYGNPIYPGGGGTNLGAGLPASAEALTAWDNWVRAMVRHFRDRVWEWEIWNEPDLGIFIPSMGEKITGAEYARFYIRTAEIIRAEQPQARLYGIAWAHVEEFVTEFMECLGGKRHLLDAITVHGYPPIPEDIYSITAMRRLAPGIEVRQGETGAPSAPSAFGAMSDRPWTELTQAKWNLRRMLAHRAHDIAYNIFTLSDLNYRGKMVYKGLLRANPDKTIAGPKLAYAAVQHVLAIFDDRLQRRADEDIVVPAPLVLHSYRQKDTGAKVVAVWRGGEVPKDDNTPTPTKLHLTGFTEPVFVDLLTGNVYAVPDPLPLYDSPILIADKSALPLDKGVK